MEKRGYRHGANAAGDGTNGADHGFDARGYVAGYAPFLRQSVDTHINYYLPRGYMARSNESRFASGDNQNVGRLSNLRQVFGLAMANGNRGVSIEQSEGGGFAD